MKVDGPSDTALQVAAARAAHLLHDPAPHLLADRVALELLGPAHADLLAGYGDEAPWMLLENRLSIPLRARFAEDRLHAAHARGVRQLVLLGAGLDSFIFRRPAALSDLAVFEVDHPNTQAWKRARLEELGWSPPEKARFVACDFERTSTLEALRATDFDPRGPTFVSWMGVTYYLEKSTVETALGELARNLAEGSEIAFDVMLPWEELPERYAEIREALVTYLAGAAEPQVNRYPESEIRDTLARAGFAEVEVYRSLDLEREYRSQIGSTLPFSERFLLIRAKL